MPNYDIASDVEAIGRHIVTNHNSEMHMVGHSAAITHMAVQTASLPLTAPAITSLPPLC